MNNLLLTLGHNSSAIWTNGHDVIGYEQERLSRIKSDSSFPINAIMEIGKHVDLRDSTNVYVSHWFDSFELVKTRKTTSSIEKYWNYSLLRSVVPNHKVISLHNSLTHHDAHAFSAMEFYSRHSTSLRDVHVIVADGFGNNGEVFSVYEKDFDGQLKLIHRIYGYENSLGLMYQFATSYCGMKENQDEYKFLGYESHISEVCGQGGRELVLGLATDFVKSFDFDSRCKYSERPFIDLVSLKEAKLRFNKAFHDVASKSGIDFNSRFELCVVIGYFIQSVLEQFYTKVLRQFSITDVVVTGGVHYNVKLNHHIYKSVDTFCACPLAGDQGAAIGVFAAEFGCTFPFYDLRWGRRTLKPANYESRRGLKEGQYLWTDSKEGYIDAVSMLLKKDCIVNTVTGNMEFGPRALCNTSTLAKPTYENVDIINDLNGRNTVMPFAPVLTAEKAKNLFHQNGTVVGSLQYMITTLDYVDGSVDSNIRGVAHPYPSLTQYSGRPQIILSHDQHPIKGILDKIGGGPVINTSLNVHGKPIVFSAKDAMDDFKFNLSVAKKKKSKKTPVLVVGAF